jgi:hypothetical protein
MRGFVFVGSEARTLIGWRWDTIGTLLIEAVAVEAEALAHRDVGDRR